MKQQRKSVKIGIDLMGNENSPKALSELLYASNFPDNAELVLIGDIEETSVKGFSIIKTKDYISNHDHPITAIKKNKNASLVIGLRLLKEGKLDAFLTSGNTGALVLASKIILSSLPGIKRPALLSELPTLHKNLTILDLGANAQFKADHLVKFTQIGCAYLKTKNINFPKVGLLNIGEEPLKGNNETKLAYQNLLNYPNPPFCFVGNIESHSVFEGTLDLLITDGFSGNIFLKTAEATSQFILQKIFEHLSIQETSNFEAIRNKLCHTQFTSALLLGVQGAVLKTHSKAPLETFVNSVFSAINFAQNDFFKSFQDHLLEITNHQASTQK